MAWNIRNLLLNIVNFTLAIAFLILTTRILFLLLSANRSAPLVSWIYNISNSLVYPFSGILPNEVTSTGSVLDLTGLLALIVYSILAYLLTSIVNAAIPNTHTDTTLHDDHAENHQPHYH